MFSLLNTVLTIILYALNTYFRTTRPDSTFIASKGPIDKTVQLHSNRREFIVVTS